ncbi:LysE family translocator [Pelagicoccus sp. SDUM812003]|uniref:LysE family translocator n=1 Tax=Pelagicoccus sp. SDUM812003 TaxID=3041267 RepID=UPI00280F1354|nr:LysE family translocator [Pelagicoccus sp. SDUM812003]MDQ8203129.1 LysE family translocator [Pelagicoccus sp. SDUM812003]
MLVPPDKLSLFALASLIMVLTPGPNMLYLISRSLCQGHKAGLISLVGVVIGFLLHMFMAAFGLSAFFLAIPAAYDALRLAGACYLLWLAWKAIRPGSDFIPSPQNLKSDSTHRLISMGFLTNALNPKIAVFYLSIFTQFLDPTHGSLLRQSIELGITQITISAAVNATIVLSASAVYAYLGRGRLWPRIQRWFMATTLTALATKLAIDTRR